MAKKYKPVPVQEYPKGTVSSWNSSIPLGVDINTLTYKGRPAVEVVDDFGSSVGIADMACVNQFGDANNSKYYHAGVVQSSDGRWFTYYQWGRIHPGKSWDGAFDAKGGTFQFTQWTSEADARLGFEAKCQAKNIKRLEKTTVGGVTVWVSKTSKKGKSKDGYITQDLATRERGLPDAYKIKDGSGVSNGNGLRDSTRSTTTSKKKVVKRWIKRFQPQVVRLATDLVGGVKTYARAQAAQAGVTPTMRSIEQVRDTYIPAAGTRIAAVGDDIDAQINDRDLIAISKLVRGLVPMPIPSGKMDATTRAKAAILSAENIMSLQADLDAFESALLNEDWDESEQGSGTNPDQLLNAKLEWQDTRYGRGKWVAETITSMTRNRHRNYSRPIQIKNVFNVDRPDRDAKFVASARRVAAQNRNKPLSNYAYLQPSHRSDLSDLADVAPWANIFLGIHGTRAVNVAPIIQTNLRLPKHLPGAQITGAAFGSGIYHAVDYFKAANYLGNSSSYWTTGGQIVSRPQSSFFFLCDVIMGDAYMTPSTGSWNKPPYGKDSVAAYPKFCRSLVNEEHIIFNPSYQRIRYVVEVKSW